MSHSFSIVGAVSNRAFLGTRALAKHAYQRRTRALAKHAY